MIVKILSSSGSFAGVAYNTNKMDMNTGELMKVANFGYLQHSKNVKPTEYKNYLKAWSSGKTSVKNKQFHAVLSCQGKEFNKAQLTSMAEAWLKEMGYGENPYMIIFHKDTQNNHVHMVSGRIDRNGKKINDSFEKIRAGKAIDKVMKLDPVQKVKKDIDQALSFGFSSLVQFRLLLEMKGYKIDEQENNLLICKYGTMQATLEKGRISAVMKRYVKDIDRINQLKPIINKYKSIYSVNLQPVYQLEKNGKQGKFLGYSSPLSDFLQHTFGVQLIYHGKEDKNPYGYTIIDNKTKNVLKGGDVLKLSELLSGQGSQKFIKPVEPIRDKKKEAILSSVIRSCIDDFSNLEEGLDKHGLSVVTEKDQLYILSKEDKYEAITSLPSDVYNILSEKYHMPEPENTRQKREIVNSATELFYKNDEEKQETTQDAASQNFRDFISDIEISGNDIDDEQILGRNRRRQKKTGENTR